MTTAWNGHLKTIVLLGALSALLVAAGGMLAPGRMPLFVLLAAAMNAGAYLVSFAGAERLGRLVSTHPSTDERVARLEALAGRPRAA